MMPTAHRPCERQCERCKEWKHHSRFKAKRIPHSTVGKIYFSPRCRACDQIERDEKKNADRPLYVIRQRAATAGHKAGGVGTEFFMTQMNYHNGLVPLMRILMSDEGRCITCGHAFLNEHDIQIEHIRPPRHNQDWARLHARNLRLFCASCNRSKSNKPFDDWLDEEEEKRLSNLKSQERPCHDIQLPLFGAI
jgi:5-methylcytosine-specific restriction endonuclease McrA